MAEKPKGLFVRKSATPLEIDREQAPQQLA